MQLANDFSKNQKLSSIALLTMISMAADSNQNKELKNKTISEHLKFFNLTNEEFNSFLKDDPSPEFISKELKSLDKRKGELLISLGYELLICIGVPSESEYNVTIHMFKEIAGIDENTFVETVEKLNALQRRFLK